MEGKYASVNHHEYFAEGVQSWFDDNRENDHDHNHVNTRAELIEHDPQLAELCREVFGDTEFRYTKPATRLTGHLAGFDPATAPKFSFPPRLAEVRKMIRAAAQRRSDTAKSQPNILLILADDLGYGDLSCYNDQSKVATPNLDRLAREGMRLTDAHSPATVCTPTRYGLMTGQMPFRVPKGGTVFTGVGGPSLIAPGRLTLPSMLRDNGYSTACVGKWHIGMTFVDKEGQPVKGDGIEAVKQVDFSRRIEGGPVDHGFDRFFGTACCPTTDWLYAFIENDRVPVSPSGLIDKARLPKHPYANDCREGLIASDFPIEEVDLVFLRKSREFIEQHVRQTPAKPFFLYHAMQAVHLPSFAAPQFQGQSKAGPHGDFILQLDYVVGELMSTLEKLGVADNTLVIFSSDNGPETTSVIHMRGDHQHDGARPWRGMKRDGWEGGHRVPFLVRWPKKIQPGQVSNQLTSLTDVMATVAAMIDAKLPKQAAEDSFNMLPAWTGETASAIRPYLLQQAFAGERTLSIRRGPWKYLDHTGSGGNRYESSPRLKPYMYPTRLPTHRANSITSMPIPVKQRTSISKNRNL